MTNRYGTYTQEKPTRIFSGVLDGVTGEQYETASLYAAEKLAKLLNEPSDCQFNCRAKREADYLQGWIDRDRGCPITEAGKRCAKRYVATGSGKAWEDTSTIVG